MMDKRRFDILSNEEIARDTFRMALRSDLPAEMGSGQFVDIAIDGLYLRRPISVCDCTEDGLVLLYKVVGTGTAKMAEMSAGDTLELLTGLGHGFNPDACRSDALLVGGGLGAAPLYLLCKELTGQGKGVTVVLGFNCKEEIVLAGDYLELGAEVILATMDGSAGFKGLVTEAIAAAAPRYDRFYCCGPLPMMRAVCRMLPEGGEASLEERMGCGAGFCYGCTCRTTKGAMRVCKDGPVFDKDDIIW